MVTFLPVLVPGAVRGNVVGIVFTSGDHQHVIGRLVINRAAVRRDGWENARDRKGYKAEKKQNGSLWLHVDTAIEVESEAVNLEKCRGDQEPFVPWRDMQNNAREVK